MKALRLSLAAVMIVFLFSGCGKEAQGGTQGDTILCTTYPMYYLTSRLTEGVEDLTVELMISDSVSCLHDYTLTTDQMRKIERADLIVMNGAGLEDFMTSALKQVSAEKIVDCGRGMADAHYWLSPLTLRDVSNQIADVLCKQYPQQDPLLRDNASQLKQDLTGLEEELQNELRDLSCRKLITFHDGFSCFADAFKLEIAASIEEEEGAEPSAAELKEICDLIETHNIPAIFVEKNGSTSAAEIIARETGVKIYTLNTMMDGQTDYFTAMRENVQAVKEALG